MTAEQAAVVTAADHFAAFDNGNQEIYFTCAAYESRQIEISPGVWAEALTSSGIIEVQKRSKWDSSTRAVREQAAALGPRPPPPPVQPLEEQAKLSVRWSVIFCALWFYTLFIVAVTQVHAEVTGRHCSS